jgi:hypothetical protein
MTALRADVGCRLQTRGSRGIRRAFMGPSETPSETRSETSGESSTPEGSRIFISYKRDAEPDASLASFLYEALASQGHAVFLDVEIPAGADWAELISNEIRRSDYFVVLLSDASTAPQGFVVAETIMARDSHAVSGHPKVLPVRLAYTKKLALRLSAAIGHLQHFEWRDQSDNDGLLMTLLQAIGTSDGTDSLPSSLLRGDHVIVTGSVWQTPALRESVAGTTIVPVMAGQEARLAVTRAKGPGFFGVKVLATGALEVAIWKGAHYRSVQSEPDRFIPMLEGDSHAWCFAQYAPDAAVLLKRPDGRKDPVVVTFDRDVVRAVWLVRHRRGSDHESFLIVMGDATAK